MTVILEVPFALGYNDLIEILAFSQRGYEWGDELPEWGADEVREQIANVLLRYGMQGYRRMLPTTSKNDHLRNWAEVLVNKTFPSGADNRTVEVRIEPRTKEQLAQLRDDLDVDTYDQVINKLIDFYDEHKQS